MEYGYENFSLRKIAKESNVGLGTIYNYFSTKQDILIQLMLEYWEEYFAIVDDLIKSEEAFLIKLKGMYDNLETFIDKFFEVWLSDYISNEKTYIHEGNENHKSFSEKLVVKLSALIGSEIENKRIQNTVNIDVLTISKFIVMNLISMARTKQIDYKSFESIIKKLLNMD